MICRSSQTSRRASDERLPKQHIMQSLVALFLGLIIPASSTDLPKEDPIYLDWLSLKKDPIENMMLRTPLVDETLSPKYVI